MRRSHRILAAAAAVAITFTGLASWLAPGRSKTGLAFAEVAETLRIFRPYSCTYTFQYQGKPPLTYRERRLSLAQRRELRADGTIMVVDMSQNPIKTLSLDPARRTATEETLTTDGPRSDPDLLRIVVAVSDGTAEDLGVKVIDGRTAHGFHRPDPINEFTVWVDPDTRLPIRVEVIQPKIARTITLSDFDFTTSLDQSLFSTTAPEGYTVQRRESVLRKPPSPEALKNMRVFRPYSCTYTFQDEGKPAVTYREMWLSLSRRRELRADGTIFVVDMSQRPERTLVLNPAAKTAIEQTLVNVGPRSDPDMLGIVGGMVNGDAEDLGVKVIDGRTAHGYHRPDPANEFTVWVDPNTKLPIRIELNQPEIGRKITLSDFDFVTPSDAALFATTAPEGYSVEKKEIGRGKKKAPSAVEKKE